MTITTYCAEDLDYLANKILTSHKTKDPLKITSAIEICDRGKRTIHLKLANGREEWEASIHLQQKGDHQQWLRSQRECKMKDIC